MAKIRGQATMDELCTIWLPKRVISKCPAIILADKRTAKVRGRIILLVVSIRTIKGINPGGVLWGTK